MNVILRGKKAWGAAVDGGRMMAVCALRCRRRISVRTVVSGDLLDKKQRNRLRRYLGNVPFYISYGCAHSLLKKGVGTHNTQVKNSVWKRTTSADQSHGASTVQQAKDYPFPAYIAKELIVPEKKLWRKMDDLTATQLGAQFPYPNPHVAHCRISNDDSVWAFGAAIPEGAERAELMFWDKLGFRMPCVSIEAIAFANIFFGLRLDRDSSNGGAESVLLALHSGETTDFAFLRKFRLQLHFESNMSPVREESSTYYDMLSNACETVESFRKEARRNDDRLPDNKKGADDDPLKVLSITLPYAEESDMPEWLGIWDPLTDERLRIPDRFRPVVEGDESLFAKAFGMALQGVG